MIQVLPPETLVKTPKDFSLLKISIIGVLVVAAAFGSGYFFSLVNLPLAFLFLIVFGLFFVIQTLLIQDTRGIILLSFLESVAIALPFFRNLTAEYLALTFILFFVLFSAIWSARKEMENSFKIRLFKVSRIALTNALSGALLFSGAIYLGMAGSQFLSEKQSKFLIDETIAPVAKALVPTYSSKMTVGDFFTGTVLKNLSSDEKAILEKAPPDLRNQLINNNVLKLVKNFEGYLGGPINLNSTVADVIYIGINKKVSNLENDAKILLSLGILIFLWFLISSTIAFPLIYFPISLLSYLLYESLLMFGFAYIQLEMRNKEVIVLK